MQSSALAPHGWYIFRQLHEQNVEKARARVQLIAEKRVHTETHGSLCRTSSSRRRGTESTCLQGIGGSECPMPCTCAIPLCMHTRLPLQVRSPAVSICCHDYRHNVGVQGMCTPDTSAPRLSLHRSKACNRLHRTVGTMLRQKPSCICPADMPCMKWIARRS